MKVSALPRPLIIGAAVLACFLCSGAAAETIVLKDRSRISAPIIKTAPDSIFVDLGFDVLRIPRRSVAAIEATPAPSAASAPSNATVRSLYTIGNPQVHSTAEGVRAFGPAVVVVKSPGGLGSGFIVHADGYLITNFHVIEGQKHLTVTQFVQSGAELKRVIHQNIRIVALDAFHDLAVLQIEDAQAAPFPTVVLGPETSVYGENVFVIGNPAGLERTVTEGILSHTGRLFEGKLFLQIDASVNPGNSGGPLFNGRGQVIGVVNMGSRIMQGLNFAIPVRHVTFLLDHIEAYAYDHSNSESGFVYVLAPPNPTKTSEEKRHD
ncbi:MAG: trypsin-like peptidase domain-containing protein [Desulfobacterales bacterium]|nr:trypsin-like peptidase domain-containing protein [Desulfobacterales bacterium]